jgi:hypothetical protein
LPDGEITKAYLSFYNLQQKQEYLNTATGSSARLWKILEKVPSGMKIEKSGCDWEGLFLKFGDVLPLP